MDSHGASGDIDLQDWVGRSERLSDRVYPAPVRALAATLEDDTVRSSDGATLPPLWHWLYFLPNAPMSQVGSDGHPKRGDFLPPISLERRMWAGSRIVFSGDLRLGDEIMRTSEILNIAEKHGRAGPMVFVTVRHTVSSPRGVAVEEEQDIVFIAMPDKFVPPKPTSVPENTIWSDPVEVDPVLLFRFSALTFNGHRIHYDRDYATEREKYPGLVVHGPLQAMLIMGAARRHNPGRIAEKFMFRAVRPLFDFDTVAVHGCPETDNRQSLCTASGAGHVGMQGEVRWRKD
ncbi:MAG: MaoC family dehydratase N-terminal domain-containing protein [Alphaproteobacteria bacterium]